MKGSRNTGPISKDSNTKYGEINPRLKNTKAKKTLHNIFSTANLFRLIIKTRLMLVQYREESDDSPEPQGFLLV